MRWLILISCLSSVSAWGPLQIMISSETYVPVDCPKNTTLIWDSTAFLTHPSLSVSCLVAYLHYDYDLETNRYIYTSGITIVPVGYHNMITIYPSNESIAFDWNLPTEAVIEQTDFIERLDHALKRSSKDRSVWIHTQSFGRAYLKEALIRAPKLLRYPFWLEEFDYASELEQAETIYQQKRIVCEWLWKEKSFSSCLKRARHRRIRHRRYANLAAAKGW